VCVCRYGDVSATNYKEQVFAMMTMLFGMTVLMGFILGGWASLLTNYQMQKACFMHRVKTIHACLV